MEKKIQYGQCILCKNDAVAVIDSGKTPLCAYHYVKQVDDGCLNAMLSREIDEEMTITEPIEIQIEIMKQKPALYEAYRSYYSV